MGRHPGCRQWRGHRGRDGRGGRGVRVLHLRFGDGFYQEAIAKAEAQGRKAPKLISVTHEHASLNAALGCAAVSGKPVATAAHVDCGTQHYGGAVHTAWHAGLPVLLTAGIPPTAYPGSMVGARDPEGHLWLQQTFDQNGIVRQYTKWDHLLKFQDNPGLTVSRALQVACTEPCGPVYLSIPREVSLAQATSARFPTLEQLGVGRPAAPEPDGIRELAARLVKADNPLRRGIALGPQPATVPALVPLCELLGLPVAQSAKRSYSVLSAGPTRSYSQTAEPEGRRRRSGARRRHPLDDRPECTRRRRLRRHGRRRAIEAPHPDHGVHRRPAAYRRQPAGDRGARKRGAADRGGGRSRTFRGARQALGRDHRRKRRQRSQTDARAAASTRRSTCFGSRHQIGETLGDDWIVFDDTSSSARFTITCTARSRAPTSTTPAHRRMGAGRRIRRQARRTGPQRRRDHRRRLLHVRHAHSFAVGFGATQGAVPHHRVPEPQLFDRHAAGLEHLSRRLCRKGWLPGGYFDPPIDFAAEARSAGAYGENVTDPAEVGPALQRAIAQVRGGTSAVVSVWLPRLLQSD